MDGTSQVIWALSGIGNYILLAEQKILLLSTVSIICLLTWKMLLKEK